VEHQALTEFCEMLNEKEEQVGVVANEPVDANFGVCSVEVAKLDWNKTFC